MLGRYFVKFGFGDSETERNSVEFSLVYHFSEIKSLALEVFVAWFSFDLTKGGNFYHYTPLHTTLYTSFRIQNYLFIAGNAHAMLTWLTISHL